MTKKTDGHRSGFVAIVGCPNVGKSTLLNRLLGEKVAIATPLPQTTRRTIRGVLTLPGNQVVFLDTPGIHTPKFKLNETMMAAARQAVAEADVVVMLVDAERIPGKGDRQVAELCLSTGRPVVLGLNKWDLVMDHLKAGRQAEYAALGTFAQTITLCAMEAGAGAALLPHIMERLPEGPAYYPEEQISDQTLRDMICELVREQVILHCGQEIPYAVAVAVDSYREGEAEDRIQATIYVERDSQKGILIGKGGRMIKAIGTAARKQMEEVTGNRTHLNLFIKVKKDWRKDDRFLHEMGYRS